MLKVRVKEFMEAQHISVAQLAERCGISRQAIHNLANGHTGGIEWGTLEAVCVILQKTPGDLLVLDPPLENRRVLLKYIGGRSASFTAFRCKETGEPYRFSNQGPSQFQYVALEDLPAKGLDDREWQILERPTGGLEGGRQPRPIKPEDYQPTQPIPKVVRSQGEK